MRISLAEAGISQLRCRRMQAAVVDLDECDHGDDECDHEDDERDGERGVGRAGGGFFLKCRKELRSGDCLWHSCSIGRFK